ncbi:hypothetical protein MXMO3_01750 [Maritalea myrionectae]|uniref:Tyr recombinase domain-containing protein n=1 Tax=Maritalea myrionectae TaxID=454601 RepID=A0A2R4MEB0_9HYPH|nr:hypothetical protein [Maritalea myrionectae]AVX04275.1 hypothetical protein MXMO3_01750 [Maritalea myrionectae]
MTGRIVRIKGLNQYKDRHGKLRRYHRASGTPIDPTLEGTALAAEVDRLDKLHRKAKSKPGSLGLLIEEYVKRSDHWRNLRPRTRKDYEQVFKYLKSIDALDTKLVEIKRSTVAISRDNARDRRKPKFANSLVTVLKKVFAFGVEYEYMDVNPAESISKALGGEKRPNRPYTSQELVAIIDNAPAQLIGPIYAATLYGLREGDVLTLTKANIRGDNFGNWLQPTTSKRVKPVWLYITPTMAEIINQQPNEKSVQIFVNSRGMPWTPDGFRSSWGKYRDRLEEQGLIDGGGTYHGLRTTVQTILDEHGYADEIKYLVAHAPKDVTEHYTITSKRKKIVIEMVECIEKVINDARGNVVGIRNKNA